MGSVAVLNTVINALVSIVGEKIRDLLSVRPSLVAKEVLCYRAVLLLLLLL
jgi:hypothetical protein